MSDNATIVPGATWVISKEKNKVELIKDSPSTVDGLSIWEAEFEGRDVIDGCLVVQPSITLHEIIFSKFPANLAIEISGTVTEGLALNLVVKEANVYIKVRDTLSDQIIVKNNWYLIEHEIVNEVRELLLCKRITLNHSINVGQLMWLRAHATQLPIGLVDVTTETSADLVRLPKIEIDNLLGVLYPYQETGVSFLESIAKESLGCILADEMGLGKTLQIISLIVLEVKEGRRPNLIICPATLLSNWQREFLQFAPHIQVLIHTGNIRTGNPATFNKFDVIIVSYETAVRDELLLTSLSWNLVVLDEAQNIKNPEAQRSVVAKSIPRRVSVAVTGTPIENRLTDLWSLADFSLQGLLGERRQFEAAYDDTHDNAVCLAPIVAPILLRRKVEEVARDLPPRIDIPQIVAMPAKMAGEYEQVRRETIIEYGKAASLVALSRLRQFCTHPKILNPQWGNPIEGMPKYTRLIEILEEIFSCNEKVLIFTSYKSMLDIFIQDIPKRFNSIWSGFIDSRVPVVERQELIDQFTAFNGPGFIALNPKAAGTGLNIITANHVIHYNPEWNPALQDQASARSHRRKQTRPVTIHQLYFADSVEAVIVDCLHAKRLLASGAITGHQGSMGASDIVRALGVSPLSHKKSISE